MRFSVEVGLVAERDETFSTVFGGQIAAEHVSLAEAQRALGQKLLEEMEYRHRQSTKLAEDAEFIRGHSDLDPDWMSRWQVESFAECLRSEESSEALTDRYWEAVDRVEVSVSRYIRRTEEWLREAKEFLAKLPQNSENVLGN